MTTLSDRRIWRKYNDEVLRISREEKAMNISKWNVDSLDWKNISAEDMVRRCTKNVNPGDIVLFHNDSKYILQALPQILEYYQRAGYRIIPISQLLLEGETWIDHAGTQHSGRTGALRRQQAMNQKD